MSIARLPKLADVLDGKQTRMDKEAASVCRVAVAEFEALKADLSAKLAAEKEAHEALKAEAETLRRKLALKEKRGKFVAPTLQQVTEEMKKHGMPATEAEGFFGFYGANGWKVGKNGMVSWEAAVVNWKRGYFEKNPGKRPISTTAPTDPDPKGWREFLARERQPYKEHKFSADWLKIKFNELKK
jgi:hypothetical protein